VESVEHFILTCPRYAAQRDVLITSAAALIDDWHSLSLKAKCKILLQGSDDLSIEEK